MNTEMLIARGVQVLCPDSVYIDATIDATRIMHEGVRINPGCRLSGRETFISADARIGTEGPVTLVNCQVGRGVELKSGFFENAVFLEGAKLGAGSHVRGGTILEEQASTAHCVGLKQTILFPFVTLGSLINFCDCLMAGGTNRKNHSEVGSSFIHFNFTPDQDKATASIFGDVPKGVMLNQQPIFLGGQGGVVGPCRIAYGTVTAAGTIVRRDQEKPDCLIIGETRKGGVISWKPKSFATSRRTVHNNLIYIGNLFALRGWYAQVRRFFVGKHFADAMLAGLIQTVEMAIHERIKRLQFYIERSGRVNREAYEAVEDVGVNMPSEIGDNRLRDALLENIEALYTPEMPYLEAIQALSTEVVEIGTRWLESIVSTVVDRGSQINTHTADGR